MSKLLKKIENRCSEPFCLKPKGQGSRAVRVNLETGLPPVVGKEFEVSRKTGS